MLVLCRSIKAFAFAFFLSLSVAPPAMGSGYEISAVTPLGFYGQLNCQLAKVYLEALEEFKAGELKESIFRQIERTVKDHPSFGLSEPAVHVLLAVKSPATVLLSNLKVDADAEDSVVNATFMTTALDAEITENSVSFEIPGSVSLRLTYSYAGICKYLENEAVDQRNLRQAAEKALSEMVEVQ